MIKTSLRECKQKNALTQLFWYGILAIMQKLSDYLKRKNITGQEFAASVKADPATISRILRGQEPRIALALRIESATKGAVKVRDWIEQ